MKPPEWARRLGASGRADERGYLAFVDGHRHVLDGPEFALLSGIERIEIVLPAVEICPAIGLDSE
jgi:hypothetical protein